MAGDHDGTERTEPASPRLIARAREHGPRPYSRELVAACTLAAALVAARFACRPMVERALEQVRGDLSRARLDTTPSAFLLECRRDAIGVVLRLAAVLALPALAAALVSSVQTGGGFHLERLVPDPMRLNPVAGLARMVSRERWALSLAALGKWCAVTGFVAWSVWGELGQIAGAASRSRELLIGQFAGAFAGVCTRLVLVLLALGALDYGRAWWAWRAGMRMSRAELVAEMREVEGDPTLRARRRARRAERAGNGTRHKAGDPVISHLLSSLPANRPVGRLVRAHELHRQTARRVHP